MQRPPTRVFVIGMLWLLIATPALANSLKLNRPAPATELTTLDGKQIKLSDLKGHTVIVAFWATWCGPCREELPLLSRYAHDHRKQGLTVLSFSLDHADSLAKVRKVAQGLAFPVGLLDQSDADGYGRIWRIPVSFVIDHAGVLRYNGWKAADPAWTEASLDRVVTPLLSTASRAPGK